MRSATFISAAAIAISLALPINVSIVAGQDTLSSRLPTDQEPKSFDSDEAVVRERVIVMKSGRVMSGFASRNAGGWLVEQPNRSEEHTSELQSH